MGSKNQKTKKRQHRKTWFWYQLSVLLAGTTLIVAFVYNPTGGWLSLYRNSVKYLSNEVTNSSVWVRHLVGSKNTKPTTQIASYTAIQDNRPSYTIRAQLDPSTHTIHGQSDIWIPNLNSSHVKFYLYTEQDEPIQISSVTMNNRPLKFVASDQILVVTLPNKMEQATLHLTFQTPVLSGGYRYGEKDNVWTIGYWYPILGVRSNTGDWLIPPSSHGYGDPFLEDNADYDITWTSPASFKWFSTGSSLTSKTSSGQTTVEWKVEDVRNFAIVGSPRFIDHPVDLPSGTVVHIATLNMTHYSQLQQIVQQAVDTYSTRFGSYYYPQLAVVEMPSGTVFAHEYPGLALFSSDIWNWPTGEHWISHEIAHGWWYFSVGNYEAQTEWLDEGLAEYSSLLYTEHRYGKKAYDQEIQRLQKLWINQESYLPDESGQPFEAGAIKVDQPYANFDSNTQYYYATYLRTTLMYADLRSKMGDTKFFAWLQQYYLKNSGKIATRSDLTNALHDVDGQYVPLLNRWLDTPNQILIQQVEKH